MSDDVRTMLSRMMNEFHQSQLEREKAAAKENPERHKLSRTHDKVAYMRYSGGRNGKKQNVYYCFSTAPNVAGYYLTWKEVCGKKSGKRIQYKAWKTAGRAETEAMRMAKVFRRPV